VPVLISSSAFNASSLLPASSAFYTLA